VPVDPVRWGTMIQGSEAWRASFDAEVTFANGGGLRAEEFRLDLPGDDPAAITDHELGALFVRHLGLLMVDRVTISNRTHVREAHKGSRGVDAETGGDAT